MAAAKNQIELAAAFQAQTEALAALDRRIDRRMRERQRLEMTFDAIAAAIDSALARGEAPLALIDELSAIDRRLQRLDGDLMGDIEAATKFFSARP